MAETIQDVVLRFLEGENEGVEIRVTPPRQLIMGRSEECDIFLAEKKISRKHCMLVVQNNSVVLQDLQSTNGTFINSEKVTDQDVRDGDKIRVGTSVILVKIEAQSARDVSKSGREAQPIEEPEMDFEKIEPSVGFADAPDSPSGVMDAPSSSDSFSIDLGEEESQPKPKSKKKRDEESLSSPERKPSSLSGELSAMGLADLLQNLAVNQKSGLLALESKNRVGKIMIQDGKLQGAEVGKAKGEKAIYRMLSWNEGKFRLKPLPVDFSANTDHGIAHNLESILMEGFRQFDEIEKIRKGLPKGGAKLRVKDSLHAPLSKLHPRVLDVFQIILTGKTFDEVLDLSPFSDLDTSKIVYYLIRKNYIEALP